MKTICVFKCIYMKDAYDLSEYEVINHFNSIIIIGQIGKHC